MQKRIKVIIHNENDYDENIQPGGHSRLDKNCLQMNKCTVINASLSLSLSKQLIVKETNATELIK